MRILIIGCGYVGSALGQKLAAEGHSVIGVTHSESSAASLARLGIEPRTADCSTPAGARSACRGGAEAVVFCLSSRGGDYQKTYVEGMRGVLRALAHQPPRLFIYTGSTSVYAQTTGEWVTETSATEPPHQKGKLLLETERLLADAARGRFTAWLLRLSGIYGPHRHALWDQLREGADVLPGDGGRWINQIHRDDAANAIMLLLKSENRPSPSAGRAALAEGRHSKAEILNVSDDAPALQRDYVDWCCRRLGRAPPIFKTSAPAAGKRSRGDFQTNRRISNRALRSLGWIPQYPDYQKGLAVLAEGGKNLGL